MHTKVSLGFDFPVGDPKQCTTVKILLNVPPDRISSFNQNGKFNQNH